MKNHNDIEESNLAKSQEGEPKASPILQITTESSQDELGKNQLNLSTNSKPLRKHEEILGALLEEISPIDFYALAELKDGEKLTKKHFLVISIQELLKTAKVKKWSLCLTEGSVYCFNGAFWKELSKGEVQTFLGKVALKQGIDKYDAEYYQFKTELFNQFISAAHLPRPKRSRDEVLINLQNGTFVIKAESQEMKLFDKNDFLTYQLHFPFTPGQSCPLFYQYLNRVLPDQSQQKVLCEFISYLFIKQKTLKLEKALILYGLGANGKSVFFEIITALLGSENVRNYSLQSLTDRTGYFRAKIANILCNYASEISPNMESTIFKQMVSGEPVEARLPYGEPFMLQEYAKLVFNTNELPKDVEHTEAFFRRFIILHFNITIPESERDPELANKIIHSELPGVFNWVLEGLKRLLLQKNFSPSEVIDNTIAQYKKDSDSIQLFLSENNYNVVVNRQTPLKLLFTEYKAYCQESHYKICSLRVFSERLKRLGFTLTRKNPGYFVNTEKIVL